MLERTIANPRIIEGVVPAPRAWHGPDVADDAFVVALTPEVMAELDQVVAEQNKAPVPTIVLEPKHFKLDAATRLMTGAKRQLDDGLGFVILDRLPVDRWPKERLIDVYWLLGSLIEPPVAQEWSGKMVYDVRYDGQGYTSDTRTALTPEGLDMHNDSSMGEAPANYLSLLCLQTAREGGKSSLSSAYAAHNFFRLEHPRLLPRLYQPFYRDKQEYQAPDVENWYPIFANEGGGLRIRFNIRPIRRGYEKTGRVLDNEGVEAVGLLNSFLSDARYRHDFWMERGQIQILNNRIVVHGRTPYVDFDEPEKRRHLVRLWLRAGDRRHFRG
jgi:Taurine catabolism dioxygenase TauD, TfdA family